MSKQKEKKILDKIKEKEKKNGIKPSLSFTTLTLVVYFAV